MSREFTLENHALASTSFAAYGLPLLNLGKPGRKTELSRSNPPTLTQTNPMTTTVANIINLRSLGSMDYLASVFMSARVPGADKGTQNKLIDQ